MAGKIKGLYKTALGRAGYLIIFLIFPLGLPRFHEDSLLSSAGRTRMVRPVWQPEQ